MNMKLSTKLLPLLGLAALMLVALPAAAPAQDLVKEALNGFPTRTVRLEFSNPAKLRALPNYSSLRQRYIGPRLRKLVDELGQLGIRETDISGLVIGWQPGGAEVALYGFATGNFSAQAIAESAQERNMAPNTIAGKQAYCLEAGIAGTCVVVLQDSVGAFGSLTALTSMLEARSGQSPAVGSDSRMAGLVDHADKDAPIWGVAVGPAISDWFRGWMPNQGSLKLDWQKVFADVNSLTYSVAAADNVTLGLKMDCKSSESAAGLRQVFDGLKLVQQMAWETQNPGRPNPFQAMNVGLQGDQVSMSLTTGYSELELATEANN
ncbi:MAG: hypothetical protein ABSF46_29810 [Terriglobia bacterium]|jgi:hypothetical protein